MGRTVALVVLAVFVGGLLQVNAPSILSGWGPVTLAVGLAAALLPPRQAAFATGAGLLLALPLQVASRSVFPIVAVAGLLLRPPSAAASSWAARRWGVIPGLMILALLSGILSLGVAIAYYGDDGIHAGLAVFDAVPLLLLGLSLGAADRRSRIVGLAGAAVFVLLTAFYWSPGAVLAALAPAAARADRLGGRAWMAGLVLVLAALFFGGGALARNLAVLSYPVRPESYGPDRWAAPPECGRSSLMQGVHSPERLRVVEPCVVLEGVVEGVPRVYDDGDYTWDMTVNDSSVLSLGSIVLRGGLLHAEVVPSDYGVLEGLGGVVCVGDRLVVRGPLVVDTDHGQWSEVHPVVEARLLERGVGPCVALPAAP